MSDQEALKAWYTEDYAKTIWENFNGDEIVEHTWLEACRYKESDLSWFIVEAKSHAQTKVDLKMKQMEVDELQSEKDFANETIVELRSKISSLEETIEFVESKRNELEVKLGRVFKDAKIEMEYRDKKITYLEAECERVYHPIREFWNQEKDEEMKRLKAENDKLKEEVADLKQKLEASESVIDCFYEATKKIGW